MKIEEDKEFKPICPHCSKPVDRLIQVKHGHHERHNVYCCPKCRKIISVGVSRS